MYADQLRQALRNFNREQALTLSDQLHQYEANGGELSRQEDRLWEQLTYKIESSKEG